MLSINSPMHITQGLKTCDTSENNSTSPKTAKLSFQNIAATNTEIKCEGITAFGCKGLNIVLKIAGYTINIVLVGFF